MDAPAVMEFSPDGAGGINSLSLSEAAGTNRSNLFLSLEATAVEDLYGVAFDLEYPLELLRFESVSEGGFLDDAGAVATSLQVAETPQGTLVMGHSRLGQVPGRSGTGTLLTLHFSRVAGGQGRFEFVDEHGFDSAGEEIAGLTWSAGSVRVPL